MHINLSNRYVNLRILFNIIHLFYSYFSQTSSIQRFQFVNIFTSDTQTCITIYILHKYKTKHMNIVLLYNIVLFVYACLFVRQPTRAKTGNQKRVSYLPLYLYTSILLFDHNFRVNDANKLRK